MRQQLTVLGCGVALLIAAGCGDSNAPTTGALDVSITTTGGDPDVDGYLVTVDGAAPQPVAVDGQVTMLGLATGPHDVELSGVASNCTVTGGTLRAVTVIGGETTEIAFAVVCVATGVQVVVATTGVDIDPDGYAVSVDDAPPLAIPVNGTVSITRLTAGSHTVALTDVVANCPVGGQNPRTVTIAMGEVATVGFPVTCLATTGTIEVRAATSGIDLDANGYTVRVDGGQPRTLAVNGTAVLEGLTAGDHSVAFADAAANCTIAGDNPRTVPVTTGGVTRDTARTSFVVTCVAVTGNIEVTVATSGLDLDADGYTVQVDGGPPRALGINGTATFAGFGAGDHTVMLAGAAANCAVSGENPRTLQVITGGATRDTARTTFQVSCVAVTGVVEVTTVTSGVALDQNGYVVQLDGGASQPVPVNGVVRFSGVSEGGHQVALVDVAANCPVSGENPRTLSVTTGGLTRDTARTTFEVACEPMTGTARVITSTTGADFDPNGYFMGVDCDTYYGCYYSYHAEQMSVNDTVTLSGVPSGPHTFQLDDLAVNCSVGGANPRSVHVTGGTTTDIVFAVTCAAFGSIQVTTTTTGVDFDVNGYRITADGPRLDATRDVAVNGTATISGLLAGDYSVSLGGVSLNCDVTSPSPVVVTVPSGGTATVGFSAACSAATELAFTMATNAGYEIHEIGSNGGGLAQLTSNTAYEDAPAWSPDGSKIAFRSDRDGNAEIYVMNADGTGQTRLTNHAAPDYAPTWSADGTWIAFVSERDGNAEVYVMNVDGTGVQRLTNHNANDNNPAWSPDGSRIAFSSTRDASNLSIYVMDASGAAVTRLSSGGFGGDDAPAWSPDGAMIAFQRVVTCEYYYCRRDLYVMNAADGSGVTQLTSGADDHADPAWSPDGLWIAFNAAPCSYYGCSPWFIQAVRSSGTDVRDVAGPTAFHPAWRP